VDGTPLLSELLGAGGCSAGVLELLPVFELLVLD